MRRFVLHRYLAFECTLPHKSFVGDYKELLARSPSEPEVNIFVNAHSTEFLNRFVSHIPSILALMLPESTTQFNNMRRMYIHAIVRHFDDLRETKRPALVVDNTR